METYKEVHHKLGEESFTVRIAADTYGLSISLAVRGKEFERFDIELKQIRKILHKVSKPKKF